jgi:hypothetical protein
MEMVPCKGFLEVFEGSLVKQLIFFISYCLRIADRKVSISLREQVQQRTASRGEVASSGVPSDQL